MNTTQPSTNAGKIDLLSCPFCGWKHPEDLIDSLYPTGTEWVDKPVFRAYVGPGQGSKSGYPWGSVWCLSCNPSEGGCGAEVRADSREEVISAWNRRVAAPRDDAWLAEAERLSHTLAQEAARSEAVKHPNYVSDREDRAMDALLAHLRARPAAPLPEPVAVVVEQDTQHHGYARAIRCLGELIPPGTKLYAAPLPGEPQPGWKLVPVEPTPEMAKAGNAADYGAPTHRPAALIYRAMIAAAPAQPELTVRAVR